MSDEGQDVIRNRISMIGTVALPKRSRCAMPS